MRKLFVGLFLIAFACQSWALTWSQVVALGAERSHDIKSAQNQLEACRWRL